ncbi:DUF4097 family beta strand repeat-containing protein [Spirochaeta cellobiosiphila]|uniref:DUF4097 family beta strand repeat-containing protein n=1 Tax=Spirochaeta cellobiosiphila TaxID=504483 RepID=UPI00042280BB|nr:DUF4097 family beta strand repeat-containing protein [Spirochaeta cellobiosiphila]
MINRNVLFVMILELLLILPLCAADIQEEESYSIANMDKVIIDQSKLKAVAIGISIVPTKTLITSGPQESLLVKIEAQQFFRKSNPVKINTTQEGRELRILMQYRNPLRFGISFGKIKIHVIVPESWLKDVELYNGRTETIVSNLRIAHFKANPILTDIDLQNSNFESIDINLGSDSSLMAQGVHANAWTIMGKLGTVKAKEVSGAMNISTFDGNIDIDFATFQGMSEFSSTLGNINIKIPEQTEMALDLSSTLEKIKTDIPIMGSIGDNDDRHIKGTTGPTSNKITAHTGDGVIKILTKKS